MNPGCVLQRRNGTEGGDSGQEAVRVRGGGARPGKAQGRPKPAAAFAAVKKADARATSCAARPQVTSSHEHVNVARVLQPAAVAAAHLHV